VGRNAAPHKRHVAQARFTASGLIVAITPYNDPLNLVAHKFGPAIAGGNAVILKPSELAPLSAINKLASYLVAAGLPESVVTVATGGAELGKSRSPARPG
jgi:glyceraldehyde-3-phosphate dehydrogenase (NADP+)